MGQYNGDQIANNPTVVANYLKAAPTTRLATRQIQFLWIYTGNTNPSVNFADQPEAPNSAFSKAVRGIQAQAEVVIIGSPSSDGVMIGVYADTYNDGNNTDPGDNYSNDSNLVRTLSQSVNASLHVTGIDVDPAVIYGYSFAGAGGGHPYERAINYVDPSVNPAVIGGSTDYNYASGHNPGGKSSYENELFTDN